MKALITGDRGFVGRHFCDFLKELSWEVYGLDIINGPDEDVVPYFLQNDDEQFDLLVHCAYDVGGRARINGSNMALGTNVTLDALMFDWALKGGAKAVLYFSSSAAYPVHLQRQICNTCDGWATGHGPVNLSEDLISIEYPEIPDSDYGWAKLTGEKLAVRARNLGLRVHVVRPFSGYGSDQGLEYPFPAIVNRAKRLQREVWGPPGQKRDWIHIDDVVAGAFEIYSQNVQTPVNLCTGIGTEMGALFKAVATEIGYGAGDINYLEDMPTGVFSRVGDPTEMLKYYTPRITLEEGIRRAL